jgi:hypothetical protein
MTTTGLLDAASVLEDQASGRVPDRARILSGALALARHTLPQRKR